MKMQKSKNKKASARPLMPVHQRETQFIRVLDGWERIQIDDPFGFGPIICAISPEKKIYRYAHSWEKPDIYIDANILPAEHAIRLVRVRQKPLRILIKKKWKERRRLERERKRNH